MLGCRTCIDNLYTWLLAYIDLLFGCTCNVAVCAVSVPDHESRDRDVVLVRRTIQLGKPRGSGNWSGEGMERGWGGGGQFTSNLGLRWTDSTTQRKDSK
jgi:hypothetical protein